MASPPTGPFRPMRLGSWEVIAKIAGGGMSAVYLGRRVDPEPDTPSVSRAGFGGSRTTSEKSHVVALKIVRHDVAKDEELVKMFLEEGKLLARLVHPNIVRTLEVGSDEEQDFIAMELMLGKPFAAIHDALVDRGVRLNPEIAAWTAARIADALHYAHELTNEDGYPLALVHRDVNPANVFATFSGEVKLFDFGLAKVTAGERSGSPMLAGKLSYLSPEQIMQMPLDRRSDIFSLGTTLWELLTSKRLFRRESDIETVRAVQLGPIPDPRIVAPEIPEELARIVRTALERNRDHRYPSAAYLAHELDAFVFTRSSPGDMAARLAQLVDTLFPGEHKRQSGWLKPAITSSSSRSMNAVTTTARAGGNSRPPPPEVRRDTRETTAVMANAPPIPPSSRERPSRASTPRQGIPSVPPRSQKQATTLLPPVTARAGVPSVPPPSETLRDAVPSIRAPSVAPRPSPRPGSLPLPAPTSRTPPRSVPPAHARPATQATPPGPEHFAPTVEVPAASMPPPSPSDHERIPSDRPSLSPMSGLSRPKRAPIPLPSRVRNDSSPPKAPQSARRLPEQRDSEPTKVDSSPPDREH